MSQSYQHILLVTDALPSSNSASETAFNLASRHGARVTVVDTVREPSVFSRWMSTNASDVFEMVLADKQKRLASIANRFFEAGLEATSEVLIGKTSEAIAKAVIEKQADLVVRIMKGQRSRFPGQFGNTSRNLMRICPCPVLLVNEKPLDQPGTLACVNMEHDIAENESILRCAEQITPDSGRLLGVYCWDFHGTEIMQGHMAPEAIEQLVQESKRIHQKFFDNSMSKIDQGFFRDRIRMENGDPSEVIPKLCRDEHVDVVVMCSASLNHPIQRYLGSTIESVLDDLPCSLLVVKPRGFRSPIQAEVSATEATG